MPPEIPPAEPPPSDIHYHAGPPGEPPPSGVQQGCVFVGGVIAGLVLFVFDVGTLGSMWRDNGIVVALVVAAGAAIACCFKRPLRGIAVGLFLGCGAFLLLIAICSGFRIN